MTKMEKEIFQIKRQISELTQKLKSLEKMNKENINFYDDLLTFSDFPNTHGILNALLSLDIHTAFDLIHTTPKVLLSTNGLGPEQLKLIEEWMSKHGITFITSE